MGDLLRRASAALAEAKVSDDSRVLMVSQGKARVLHAMLPSRPIFEVRRDRDEIDILFQPQVSIATGKVMGAEGAGALAPSGTR